MIRRRNFVFGTALAVVAPAVAGVASLASSRQSPPALGAGGLQSPPAPKPKDANTVAFKVHGWTPTPTTAHDGSSGSSADRASDDAVRDDVWISISQSWKTAWR
jgi:hypothetical protein